MADITIITVTDGIVTEVEDIVSVVTVVDSVTTEVVSVDVDNKWVSNKMTFVVGTTNGVPVPPGPKAEGTRFRDGTVAQWVIRTDVPTTLSARIRKSSAYPTFSDFLALSLTADDYATGTVSIPIQHLDVLSLVIDSNDEAQRVSVELFIR